MYLLRYQTKFEISLSYPHFAGMPVYLCGKPGDIFHDGDTRTAQHHQLKAAFRHPTYPQRLCADFPTFDISFTTLQQHKANPATDNPTSDISKKYHLLQSRHSDNNNNRNALRQYGKTTFLYINNFTSPITRHIQPPRHYDNTITLLALMCRHSGNPPLYHCM